MTGVSLLALSLGMAAALASGPARAQDTRTVVDGSGGGGVILLDADDAAAFAGGGYSDASDGILASGGFSADAADMVGISPDGVIQQGAGGAGDYVVSNKIFSNFITEGGAGSGGGAGLGGVFFVNQNASLTLNNVDFTRNTVIGGQGGSTPAQSVGSVQIALGEIDLPFLPISAYQFDPVLSGSNYNYTVSSLTLKERIESLKPGMRIALPGSSTLVEITSISADRKTLTFASPVAVSSSLFRTVGLTDGLDRGTGQSGTKLQFGNTDILAQVQIGSFLTLDGNATDIKITAIDVQNKTVTLSAAPDWDAIIDSPGTDEVAEVGFLNLTRADISLVKSVSGQVITVAGENGLFKPGMVLAKTDDKYSTGGLTFGDSDSVTITGVVYDPATNETRITVQGTLPTDLTTFAASYEQATIGSNVLKVASSRLVPGMRVTGPGLTGDVFIGAVNTDGTVTLVGSDGTTPVNITVKPDMLTFSNVTGVSGSAITFANASMLDDVTAGMVVSGAGIPEGTTVVSITGSVVTLSSPPASGVDLTNLTFGSETSTGGSMNNLAQTITGSTGKNGNSGWPSNVIWGDGEGNDGFGGGGGGDGTVGAGGTGGTGGNGSSALSWNPDQIWTVVDSAADAALDTAAAAAALATVPPDVAESVVATLAAAKDFINLGKEVGILVDWSIQFAAGNNALGGDAGEGGYGGSGDDFFGGGAGGAGGDGGDAGNLVLGSGGDGGDGGRGGTGGFGGGGGMGGAGGTYGDGVMAPTNTGWGGWAGHGGFGGGDGANGDGYGGDGGDGFGGAIFVRDGGALTITGNSTFDSNGALGGDAGEGGAAGAAAGADLFMMRGSTVVIRPGATGGVDNVVTFNGTIGDDSRESYVGAPNGKGFGAGLTIGKGLTIFNGRNTYTGQTTMEGGVLQADDGWGLNTSSNLNFNGAGRTGGTDVTSLADNTYAGVLMTSGYFSRQLGTDGTKVQWTGSGGFAALGDELVVNLGNQSNSNLLNPQKLTWGATPGFFTAGGAPVNDAALVFGSEHADSVVRWINPIDLGSLSRQIVVADNDGTDGDFAVMEGAISGTGGLIVGEAGSTFWDGTLVLTGQNSFTGDIDLRSGTLAIAGGGTLATGVDVDIADDASLQIMADGLSLGIIDNAGTVTVGADLQALGIHNTGDLLMMGDIDLSPGFPFASDDPANYNGDFFNDGGTLTVATSLDAAADSAHTLTVDQFRGNGDVYLGVLDDAPILTIAQRGESTFDGKIMGNGGLTLTAPAGAIDPASKLTLTQINTYRGPTVIDVPSTLALKDDGRISSSASVQVDGTFDIADVTTSIGVGTAGPTGTLINDLSGAASGSVVLGDNLLVIDNAASEFAGVISGTGDVAIEAGEQTLSGINTYTGETYVLAAATLALAGAGSIADSVRVVVEGELDISGTNDGAEIKGLEGGVSTAKVTLGDERLTITDANASDTISSPPVGTSFAGVISGEGGVTVEKGRQTLTNVNDYTGTTIVDPDGELYLVGSGGIAESESVTVNGIFDIAGTTAGAEIIQLLGTDLDAEILLGSKLLTLTGDGNSEFAGVITGDGDSGLTIEDGTLKLTNASPDYDGKTTIEEDATLLLVGDGSITGSTIDLSGVFDISGVTTANTIPGLTLAGTSVFDLYGDGKIDLGDNTLAVTHATGGTFSGPITGDGAFGVAGGTLNLDFTGNPTVNANIFAATGGKVVLTGGTIDTTSSDQSALSVINGGVIDVTNTTLVTDEAHPTASVLFDDSFDAADNPAHIVLGAGTVLQNEGPLLVVTRDDTGGSGSAFNGNVNFIIDNASTVVGDILDLDAIRAPGMGGTTVYLGEGVDWTGMTVAADFLVKAGAAAHFEAGSLLNNLTAESGALVNILTGNLNVLGTLTLNSNGIVAPGASPGTFNIGNFVSNDANNPMWIRFGQPDPLPGSGADYSQINVQGDFTGTLGVSLERYDSDQSTPLGNLGAIELIRIGGDESGTIVLAKRFVQNGHELQLDRRIRKVDPLSMVAGDPPGGVDEDQYFNFDPPNTDTSIIAYGLKAIVQDETYGLATLTGTIHQAGLDTLGTFVERRGTDELESSWMRVGANHTEVGDKVANVQDIGFAQFGVDLVQSDVLRGGVIGSYTASKSSVETDTGTDGLQGNMWSGGAYATWTNGGAYVDAVGQYGYSNWTFSPTAASNLTVNGHTALAAVEAGVKIGNDQISVTPWSQMVWQSTFYQGLDSAWVDDADFVDHDSLFLRGGLRAEGKLGGFAPYLDLSLSHDVNDRKTVTVDGFDLTTGMGGTRVELGAGFQADISDSMEIWTQVKGAYGIGEGDVLGYQGRAGVRASW